MPEDVKNARLNDVKIYIEKFIRTIYANFQNYELLNALK